MAMKGIWKKLFNVRNGVIAIVLSIFLAILNVFVLGIIPATWSMTNYGITISAANIIGIYFAFFGAEFVWDEWLRHWFK